MAHSMHRARTVVDATQVERLESLAGAIIERLPDVGYPLVNKLTSAMLLSPMRLPSNIVTIGSDIVYHEDHATRNVRVTLSWPEEADISRGKVSVLTPVGTALLGLSAGDHVKWTNRAGDERSLTVLDVARSAVGTPAASSPERSADV